MLLDMQPQPNNATGSPNLASSLWEGPDSMGGRETASGLVTKKDLVMADHLASGPVDKCFPCLCLVLKVTLLCPFLETLAWALTVPAPAQLAAT